MSTPFLSIDLGKIEHNARAIVELCSSAGVEVAGVTKGVCGHPAVAQAMLRGGVAGIADSRLLNLARLRGAGIAELMLLRVPALSEAAEVAAAAAVSLNSELAVLNALSDAAARQGARHDVIVMVELGDLREGVPPESLVPFVTEAVRLSGIRVLGLGANFACFSGLVPSAANLQHFVDLAEEVEAACAVRLERLSAMNSSGLELLAAGVMPRRINHARIGEAILLGRETTRRRPWPGTYQDAFVLHAEVLECRRKRAAAGQELGEDAFGSQPAQPRSGSRVRALVNVGRADIDERNLAPRERGIEVLGASSGYTVLDVTDAAREVRVGTELTFVPGYGALLRAMTSEYVEKRCH